MEIVCIFQVKDMIRNIICIINIDYDCCARWMDRIGSDQIDRPTERTNKLAHCSSRRFWFTSLLKLVSAYDVHQYYRWHCRPTDRPTSPDLNRFMNDFPFLMWFVHQFGRYANSLHHLLIGTILFTFNCERKHVAITSITWDLLILRDLYVSHDQRKKEIQLNENENENENSKMCNKIDWKLKEEKKETNRRMETAQHTYMHIKRTALSK